MSIQSEMDRIRGNVQSTLTAIADTGVSVPPGANSDALPAAASALANTKQDKLTGKAGQIVGFDAQGNAQAQDANFLPLTGGAVNGDVEISGALNVVPIPDFGDGIFIDPIELNVTFSRNTETENPLWVAFSHVERFKDDGATGYSVFSTEGDSGDIIVSGIASPEQDTDAANKAYVDQFAPQETTITLTTAGWVLGAAAPEPSITPVNQQTVSVPGILKDQTKQTVDVAPADKASRDAWAKANIWCNDPTADGSLTFVCDTVPTAAVNVRVRWQGVKT